MPTYCDRLRFIVGKRQEIQLLELGVSNEHSNEYSSLGNVATTQNFSSIQLDVLRAATNNFCDENRLGDGGFGPVYKGTLPNGEEVAIKRLSRGSRQGLLELKNELLLIAKLQHTNLVRVLGFCVQGEEKMLAYEYMPHKSLDTFIFGIAQGLLYLHKYSRLKIIHRNLKLSNILLDQNMDPKISNFGMARIYRTNEVESKTRRIAGTYGYMSPEYAMGRRFSVKSDVYSFGVVVLEIVSGQKNTNPFHSDGPMNLVVHAWELWTHGTTLELVDPILRDSCDKNQVLRCFTLGLLCVEDSPVDGPSMSEVIGMLTGEMQLPVPKQPALTFTGRSMMEKSLIEWPFHFCDGCKMMKTRFSSFTLKFSTVYMLK
ncbi:hypothetical protein PTKIN_Ptkin16aG0115600 [Pterospermum kingtungense]